MTAEFELDGLSSIFDWDQYDAEAQSFLEDVHLLILQTLHASRQHLRNETAKQHSEIEAYLEKSKGETAERLAQDHADLGIQLAQQERFLRNQALVSLMSRLTHALLSMAKSSETWGMPRSRNVGNDEGGDEFKKIWREYRERFGLNLSAKYIGFVDRYRRVRNRIVHYGGEANSYLPYDEIDAQGGVDGMFDFNFSKRCPEFVFGVGYNAEVDVTDELLNFAVNQSCELVTYAAKQLRVKELEFAKQERAARYRAENPSGEMPL